MRDLTGQDYINIIDYIFDNPNDFLGFTIRYDSGTVARLAYLFNLDRQQVKTVLYQMLEDGQIKEVGYTGIYMHYSIVKG